MQHGSGVRNSKRGDRTAYPGALAIGPGVSHRKAPGNAFFQIAAPRSDPLAGSAPGIWVRRRTAASALTLPWRDPRPARFPARLSGQRLIVSVGLDKGQRPFVQPPLTIGGAFGGRFGDARAFTCLWRNRFTACLAARAEMPVEITFAVRAMLDTVVFRRLRA